MIDESRLYTVTRSDRDRLRDKAHQLINFEIRHKRLAAPTLFRCTDCGERTTCYDHRDYRKPLEVAAVCKGCNNKRGPGLPFPTGADQLRYKNPFRLLTHEHKAAGERWSKLGGGEGYSPLEFQCHVNVADYECWWLDDGRTANGRANGTDFSSGSRWDFFKKHDIYALS